MRATFTNEDAIELHNDFYKEEINQITDKIKALATKGKRQLILKEAPPEGVIEYLILNCRFYVTNVDQGKGCKIVW